MNTPVISAVRFRPPLKRRADDSERVPGTILRTADPQCLLRPYRFSS